MGALIAASDVSELPFNWPRQTRYSPENSRISEIECPSPPPPRAPTQLPTVKIRRVDSAEEARLLSPFRSSTWDCHVALLCFSPAPQSCFLPSMFPVTSLFQLVLNFHYFRPGPFCGLGIPFRFRLFSSRFAEAKHASVVAPLFFKHACTVLLAVSEV